MRLERGSWGKGQSEAGEGYKVNFADQCGNEMNFISSP